MMLREDQLLSLTIEEMMMTAEGETTADAMKMTTDAEEVTTAAVTVTSILSASSPA